MKKREKLYEELLGKYGITDQEMCSKEECKQFQKAVDAGRPLPDGITQSWESWEHFYRKIPKITDEEAEKVFYAGLCKDIKTMKSCIVFFTTLTVINLICSFILFVKILSAFK